MGDERDLLEFDTASEFLVGEGLPGWAMFLHVFLDHIVAVVFEHLFDQRGLQYQDSTLRGRVFELERSVGR